jgi:hypothetical protein
VAELVSSKLSVQQAVAQLLSRPQRDE